MRDARNREQDDEWDSKKKEYPYSVDSFVEEKGRERKREKLRSRFTREASQDKVRQDQLQGKAR